MAAVKRSGAVSILLLTALFARGDEDARGRDWLWRIGDAWAESGGACRTFARYRGSAFAGGIELTVTPVKDSRGPSLEVRVANEKSSAVLTLRRDLTRDEKGGTMPELAEFLPFVEAPPASGPARISAAGAQVTYADTGFLRTVRIGDESIRCAVIEARDSRGGVSYFMVSPSGAAIESVNPALGLRVRPVSPDARGGDLPADPVPAPLRALAAAVRASRGSDAAAIDAAFDFTALTECASCNWHDLTPEQRREAVATNRVAVLDRFRTAELPASLPDDGIEAGLALIVECELKDTTATLRAPGLPDVGMRRDGERWTVVSLGSP